MTLTSLWQDRHPRTAPSRPAVIGGPYDVAVVGAGLTGLTTALLLGRAGQSVVVLEAGYVGSGTTGRSSAKASCLQGTHLSTIAGKHSARVVRTYVEAQREGLAWLGRFCADHGVEVQTRDAVTYAYTAGGESRTRQELELARSAGLPPGGRRGPPQGPDPPRRPGRRGGGESTLPLPFPTRGGVRLADQLQVDPLE